MKRNSNNKNNMIKKAKLLVEDKKLEKECEDQMGGETAVGLRTMRVQSINKVIFGEPAVGDGGFDGASRVDGGAVGGGLICGEGDEMRTSQGSQDSGQENRLSSFQYKDESRGFFRVMVSGIGARIDEKRGINPLVIGRIINREGITGVKCVRRVAFDKYMVEFESGREANEFAMKSRLEGSYRVYIPLGAVAKVGVIDGVDPDMEEEEILYMLERCNPNICFAKVFRENRIVRGGGEIRRIPTERIKVYEYCNELPETVTIEYTIFRMNEFIPRPIRCYKCQRFGHKAGECKSLVRMCARCGEDHIEEDDNCINGLKCVNCGRQYPAFDWDCPARQREQRAISLMITKNMSRKDARRMARSEFDKGCTYGENENVAFEREGRGDFGGCKFGGEAVK